MNCTSGRKICFGLPSIFLLIAVLTSNAYSFSITMETESSVSKISGILYDGRNYDIDFVSGKFEDFFNVDTKNCIWNEEVIVDYSMGFALSDTINTILNGFGRDTNGSSIARTDGFGYYVMPIGIKGIDPYTGSSAFGAIESHNFYGPIWNCYGRESMLPGYLGTPVNSIFAWAHVTLTPVPEPPSILLAIVGLIGFGFGGFRSRKKKACNLLVLPAD